MDNITCLTAVLVYNHYMSRKRYYYDKCINTHTYTYTYHPHDHFNICLSCRGYLVFKKVECDLKTVEQGNRNLVKCTYV